MTISHFFSKCIWKTRLTRHYKQYFINSCAIQYNSLSNFEFCCNTAHLTDFIVVFSINTLYNHSYMLRHIKILVTIWYFARNDNYVISNVYLANVLCLHHDTGTEDILELKMSNMSINWQLLINNTSRNSSFSFSFKLDEFEIRSTFFVSKQDK